MFGCRAVVNSQRISLTLKFTINNMKRSQAMVPLRIGFPLLMRIDEAPMSSNAGLFMLYTI